MRKIQFLIFPFVFVVILLSCSGKKNFHDSELIRIQEILVQLDTIGYLPKDVYPVPPPPLPPKEYFDSLFPELSQQKRDSLYFSRKKQVEAAYLEMENRVVDSSYIIIAVYDTLFSACAWCGIRPDSLLQRVKYAKYQPLVEKLKAGVKSDKKINFTNLPQNGRYRFKSISDFPEDNKLFETKFNFLFGGKMDFSRFYLSDDLAILYYTIQTCRMDCGSGYLVLLRKENNLWKIEEVLLQWIT